MYTLNVTQHTLYTNLLVLAVVSVFVHKTSTCKFMHGHNA